MDLLSSIKRGTKDYLMQSVVPSLVEALTELAIHRPEDPHLFLAQFILKRASSGAYAIGPADGSEAVSGGGSGASTSAGSASPAAPSSSPKALVHHALESVDTGPGMLVGGRFRVTSVIPHGTVGSGHSGATVHAKDVQSDLSLSVEVGEAEDPFTGSLEDMCRRLTVRAGVLTLASPEEGRLRALADKGGVKGVTRAVKIGGLHVMLSVTPAPDGSVTISAFDVRTSTKFVCSVPPARVPTLPPSLVRPPNPASPPLPDAWDALSCRLSISHATSPPTLLYS